MYTEIETKLVQHPVVFAAADNWSLSRRDQLAQIFSDSWREQAKLPLSLKTAKELVEALRPNTFVLVDQTDPETILAQVHTAPVTIQNTGRDGMLEFIGRYC